MLVLAVPVKVAVPMVMAPSLKVTVPVGTLPLTLAVKVTLTPTTAVVALVVKVVVVVTAWAFMLKAILKLNNSKLAHFIILYCAKMPSLIVNCLFVLVVYSLVVFCVDLLHHCQWHIA